MKNHRNLFSSAVILYSLLTKQQKCLVPSTRKVTIEHVPSLGRVVATWQQTDQLGRYAHKFTLFWPSYFNFFCPANTLKTLCMLHWTAERETTGLKLQIRLVSEECFVVIWPKIPTHPLSLHGVGGRETLGTRLFPTLALVIKCLSMQSERWFCWYTFDQWWSWIGFTYKFIWQLKSRNRHNVESFYWRCSIFRLAKPAFFRNNENFTVGRVFIQHIFVVPEIRKTD